MSFPFFFSSCLNLPFNLTIWGQSSSTADSHSTTKHLSIEHDFNILSPTETFFMNGCHWICGFTFKLSLTCSTSQGLGWLYTPPPIINSSAIVEFFFTHQSVNHPIHYFIKNHHKTWLKSQWVFMVINSSSSPQLFFHPWPGEEVSS